MATLNSNQRKQLNLFNLNDNDANSLLHLKVKQDTSGALISASGTGADLSLMAANNLKVSSTNGTFTDLISTILSLDTYTDGVSTDLSSEISATSVDVSTLQSTDVVLSQALSSEISATSVDVSTLTSKDADLESAIMGNTMNITLVDNEVDTLRTDQSTNLSTAVSALESSDTVLSQDLSSEISATSVDVSTLQSTDVVLSEAISSEISATNLDIFTLQSIDADISDALSSEIIATSTDVSTLSSVDVSMQSEIVRVDNRIEHILVGTDINTDQLSEIIALYEAADMSISSNISTNSVDISSVVSVNASQETVITGLSTIISVLTEDN